MATYVSLGYCAWLAGQTWNDQVGRLDVAGATILGATRGGVLQSATNPLAVLASSGMNITVNAGTVIIPSSAGVTNGAYRVVNPQAQSLTVTTAPSSPNSRIDLVVANVVDNGNNTSFGELQIVPGTPGNPPSAPSAPTNSLTLAQVLVGSGVLSIVQANITDQRIYTAAAGGVTYFPSTTSLPAGIRGAIGYDNANNRFFHWSDSGYQPMKIAPFAPAHVVGNGAGTLTGVVGGGGSFTTLLCGSTSMAANVTVDGQTDLEIHLHWPGVSMATPTATQLVFQIWLDSTVLDEVDLLVGASTPTFAYGGQTVVYKTSSATSDTPSAGAHTVSWQALAHQQSVSEPVTIVSTAQRNSYLHVQPLTG